MWCSLWLWKILECSKGNRFKPPRNQLVPFIFLQNTAGCVGRNRDPNATSRSIVDCTVIFCGSILPIVLSPWYFSLWCREFCDSLKLHTINFYNLVKKKRTGLFLSISFLVITTFGNPIPHWDLKSNIKQIRDRLVLKKFFSFRLACKVFFNIPKHLQSPTLKTTQHTILPSAGDFLSLSPRRWQNCYQGCRHRQHNSLCIYCSVI